MREHGIAGSADGLVPFGHLCWAYCDTADYHARALEYAADGVAAGQYVEYVGQGSAAALRDELARLAAPGPGPVRDALGTGRIGTRPLSGFYRFCGDSDIVDPAASAAARAADTEKARAAGYTGLRVIVDSTSVARTPAQREAFARYEYLIDQQMTALPFTILCAFNGAELGASAIAELACLHPYASPGTTMFQLYASPGAAFALAGEIDLDSASLLPAALARTTLPEGPDLLIDARPLDFIDHRGLLALDHYAQAHHRTAIVRTTSPAVAKIAQLLSFQALRVKAVAR